MRVAPGERLRAHDPATNGLDVGLAEGRTTARHHATRTVFAAVGDALIQIARGRVGGGVRDGKVVGALQASLARSRRIILGEIEVVGREEIRKGRIAEAAVTLDAALV